MSDDRSLQPGDSVVAYIRDSGGDKQELSADQQLAYIRDWCQQNGFVLGRVFIDSASGTSTAKRTQFKEMIDYLDGHTPERGLVIWRHNRFARNVVDAQYHKSTLRFRGYTIHSIMDNIPQGLFMYVIEALEDTYAQQKSQQLSEDVRRGLYHNLEQFGTLGGFPPRGFKRKMVQIATHRDGSPHMAALWVPDPEKIPLVKKAWRMRAAGMSYGKILKAVPGLYKSANGFTTFFRNKIYIGILEFGDTVIEDYCEPVIDMETWNAVQELNRKNKERFTPRYHPRRASSAHILSGILECGVCGAPMSGTTIKSKDGERYGYYRCTRRNNQRVTCNAIAIPKDELEQMVLRKIAEEIASPENISRLQAIEAAEIRRNIDEADKLRAAYTTQRRNLQSKITHIVDAIAAAGHSDILIARLREFEAEIKKIDAEIEKIENLPEDVPSFPAGDEISAKILNVLQNATLEQKRAIVRGLVERIVAHRQDELVIGTIYYYRPPDEIKKKSPHKGVKSV